MAQIRLENGDNELPISRGSMKDEEIIEFLGVADDIALRELKEYLSK